MTTDMHTSNGHAAPAAGAAPLTLDSLAAAVAEQLQRRRAAADRIAKLEQQQEQLRQDRAAAHTSLYELRDQAQQHGKAAAALVQAMLREAGVQLPPSRR